MPWRPESKAWCGESTPNLELFRQGQTRLGEWERVIRRPEELRVTAFVVINLRIKYWGRDFEFSCLHCVRHFCGPGSSATAKGERQGYEQA
jgi:hypothetical protein